MAFASKALRAALAFGAIAGVTTAVPAQAEVIPTCAGSYSADQVFSTGAFAGTPFTCQAGDKIYRDFKDPVGVPGDFSLAISDADPFHILTTGGTYNPGVFSFFYSVDIDTSLTPDRYIASFTTDFQLAGSPGEVAVGTKKLTALVPAAGPATATRVAGTAPAPSVNLPVNTQTVDFFTELTINNGFVGTGITDTIFQAQKPSDVPGPLPILGASVAFGFSRKLRRRVSQTA